MMHESAVELSVNRLLDELYKSLYNDKILSNRASTNHLTSNRSRTSHKPLDHEAIPTKLLRRCKNRAYEILLKKNPVHDASDEGFAEIIDPMFELRFSQFEYNLYVGQMRSEFETYGHLSENIRKKITQKLALFDECIEAISSCSYFSGEHDGHAILLLLVLLRGNQMDSIEDTGDTVFSLNANALPELRLNEPKWCRLNWPQTQVQRNPYCAEDAWRILNGNFKSTLFYTPTNVTHNVFGRQFDVSDGLHLNRMNRLSRRHQTHQPSMQAERRQAKLTKKASTAIQYTSNKWEQLGQRFVLCESNELLEMPFEPNFASEMPKTAMHLTAAKSLASHQLFEANVTSMQKFIEHLKLLLVGIESDSFLYCKEIVSFKMVDHLTIDDGTLPESIEHFVRDFIECGTCYKRLKVIIKAKLDGFVFRAMSASFDKYLEMFHRFIIFGTDRTLVELVLRVSPLIKQLRVLAKVLAIHPDDNGKAIPRGSEFLGYLYKQIIGVTQTDVSALLVFVLTECCDIYFRNFENWIFYGVIDDPCKELFVEFVNHYRPKTKFYFDKAYFIKRQSVPGFLQGWEKQILLCGKYANLLKLYKPTHALFSLSPPSISVCQSFHQLKKLELACHEYRRQAQSVCGPSISVADVFKRKADNQRIMAERVAQKCQRDIEQWQVDRDVRANDARERKENDRLILLQQIQEDRERKILKRHEQLEADREYLRQSEQVELELMARENAQRQRNIDYYSELSAIVDAQRKRVEDEMDKLTKQLESSTTLRQVTDDGKSDVSSPMSDKCDTNDSDSDSVYFDAEKSISPEVISTLPRSASDFLNSNAADSPVEAAAIEAQSDRQRNRNIVLTSNIHLSAEELNEPITKANAPKSMTEAQQNKLKMLQQEFNLIGADTNSNEVSVQRVEMSDLQRNRNKVLSQEYGTPTTTVRVPSEQETELERNRRVGMGHGEWGAVQADDCNANQLPMTDLQRNRHKVLTQEYNFADPKSMSSSMTSSTRSRLKASLSLDLDSGKKKSDGAVPKSCQSDFVNSPMSTTSDGPLLEVDTTEMTSSITEATENDKVNLRLDTEKAIQAAIDASRDSASTSAAVEATPLSALNTAGVLSKQSGFVFDRSPLRQPAFSPVIQPKFPTTNFFDIDPRLGTLSAPIEPKRREAVSDAELHSNAELRALNVANLTEFLQQSFTIPLQVQLSLLNNEILKIFFVEFDILQHFKSLRHYFFMMDGEFACNISDGILTKLHKVRSPSELMNSHVLHSILENALHSSIIGNDKNALNLSFFIPNVPDHFDLASPNVLRDLHLSYKVDWPLNLLLSDETIEHYGFVFQHLLKLRRITWLLDQCFYKLKDIRKQSAERIQQSSQFRHVQQIRHKLLCFINALQTHITSVALQGSWQLFQEELQSVKSMEELYKKHTKYLKRVEFLCMLNKSSHEFYTKMEDIFVVVLRFCYNLQSKNWRCSDHGVYTHPKYEKLLTIESDFVKLIKYIIYAGQKMYQCGYQTEISEFIHMINMNGFYDEM